MEIAGQAPGRFEATIYDDSNPIYFGRFAVNADTDPPAQINIRTVKVTGKVHRGTSPIESALIFGGKFGAVHLEAKTDADGEFSVNLPRQGRWDVDVAPVAGASTKVTVNVSPTSEGEASLDIALNDNRLQGIVLDEKDKPVGGADVSLFVGAVSQIARSTGDGTFVFASVPVGDAHLVAYRGTGERQRQSNAVTLSVSEGTDARGIELRLQAATQVVGQVLSPLGPVAGSAITIFSMSRVVPFRTQVTSDMDGGFTFQSPDGLHEAIAVVSPPGFPLRAFEIPLDGRLAVLNLPGEGGTLRLHRPADFPDDEPVLMAVTQDGRTIPPDDLIRWARSQGISNTGQRDLIVPSVAPASYRLCVARASRPADALCASGVLAPNADLDLSPMKP